MIVVNLTEKVSAASRCTLFLFEDRQLSFSRSLLMLKNLALSLEREQRVPLTLKVESRRRSIKAKMIAVGCD
jgi:hypothetical protein